MKSYQAGWAAKLGKTTVGLVPALMLSGLLLWTNTGIAGEIPSPAGRDKCPVCGMFVAKYPDWTTAIRFKDGKYVYFDGCKDLFSYYLNLNTYGPSKSVDRIQAVQVKDYYTLAPIDGRKAYYVVGSDVYGPMGKELVAFGKRADAEAFMQDHKGKKILSFEQVGAGILKSLQ